jgi:hypothetical protein
VSQLWWGCVGKKSFKSEWKEEKGDIPVAASPEGLCKVVAAVLEGPAVEEEAGLGVEEVLDVDEKLALGLLDVVRAVEHLSDLCQRENRHH